MVGDNSYSQTRYILKKIGAMLHDAGFTYADVVQTRLSLPDLTSWPGIARAYKETFETIRPAFSVHHVLPFLNPTLLLEIEVTAVKDQTPNS
jgi:enamine deaminase RidA (YjgF/YER057c/UK114 family)